MLPQTQPAPPRNSSRVNLVISLVVHGLIVAGLVYFAAREGLLGHQMRKIAVQMVKEKPPEKPKEPEKPRPEPPKVEPVKTAQPPTLEPPKTVAAPPPPAAAPATAPPAMAPPPAELPSFVFEGGKTVVSTADPVQLYRGTVEYALRSNWQRPPDIADRFYVAVVEVAIDAAGRISGPTWKKGSGDARWDESVRRALAATPTVSRPPPTNFPPRVAIRFDVQEETDVAAP